jgi:hypothetical protein
MSCAGVGVEPTLLLDELPDPVDHILVHSTYPSQWRASS